METFTTKTYNNCNSEEVKSIKSNLRMELFNLGTDLNDFLGHFGF